MCAQYCLLAAATSQPPEVIDPMSLPDAPRSALLPLVVAGRALDIEWAGVGRERGQADTPLIVFLHEGLGSVAMWRDFPQQLCQAVGACGLVYSRPGHGRSTPREAGEAWAADFMHQQAHAVLPALLAALCIDPHRQPLWLLGHSDGGSIALLFASQAGRDDLPLAGCIVIAPHIMVEEVSITRIAQAGTDYLQGELRQRLARFHGDVDSAFGGWSGIWLDPAFRSGSIEAELPAITCPLLAIQGECDQYGSLEQVHGIARRVSGTRLLTLPGCGHSPHRESPQAVIDAVATFMHRPLTA
jgi:pimeloyl-ACP methyl ester carboxylesterase